MSSTGPRQSSSRPLLLLSLPVALLLAAAAGCLDTGPTGGPDAALPVPVPDAAPIDVAGETAVPPADVATPDAGAPDGPVDGPAPPDADATPVPDAPPPAEDELVVGAWNLHNFSIYGSREFRIDDIAARIGSLPADVLGVEEIKVEDGSNGQGTQAWDELLARLPEHTGIRNEYNLIDTTVGLIYRRSTTTLVSQQALFVGDTSAFPRPPLEATVDITRGQRTERLRVIVVHLKAFADSVDRRREACAKLDAYMQAEAEADRRFLVIGDFNDDPHDAAAENSYTGTFLDAEPTYHFVTASLPPETVTSLGYYHVVNGQQITGEFLDHAVMTGPLFQQFSQVVPEVIARPEAEFKTWERMYSDHFPLLIHLRF